jgi:hypothetical protein
MISVTTNTVQAAQQRAAPMASVMQISERTSVLFGAECPAQALSMADGFPTWMTPASQTLMRFEPAQGRHTLDPEEFTERTPASWVIVAVTRIWNEGNGRHRPRASNRLTSSVAINEVSGRRRWFENQRIDRDIY